MPSKRLRTPVEERLFASDRLLTRRTFLRAGALAGAGLLAAACQPTPSPTSAPAPTSAAAVTEPKATEVPATAVPTAVPPTAAPAAPITLRYQNHWSKETDAHYEGMNWLFKEFGVWPVEIVAEDPLFEGVGNPILVRESHRSEIKQLPDGFRLLASSADCRIQAMVHETLPLYGTQFHPESRLEHYLDGHRIVANFFRIARDRA